MLAIITGWVLIGAWLVMLLLTISTLMYLHYSDLFDEIERLKKERGGMAYLPSLQSHSWMRFDSLKYLHTKKANWVLLVAGTLFMATMTFNSW